MQYNFEWDPVKAASNVSKHDVRFEDAVEVFRDPMALTIFDEGSSSNQEERWITLGQLNGHHYLVVVHTYKGQNSNTVNIRVISARNATKHEIRQYEQG